MLGDIPAILSSSVVAATLTALIANYIVKKNNDKNQSLKYITEERAKWREFVKNSASIIYARNYNKEIVIESRKEIITKLILSLNPIDDNQNKLDQRLVSLLKQIEDEDHELEIMGEFRECISILLKHDFNYLRIR